MIQNQSNQKNKIRDRIIILLSGISLIVCITILFPQVRQMILDLTEQDLHIKTFSYQIWLKTLLSFAIGGICFILFFDYCTLTNSGKEIVRKVKQEIKECLYEIDFRSFRKPVLIMSGIYLLGILAIIRANFLYEDDIQYAVLGFREWFNWSRYFIVFLSYFVQPEISMTDISPIPQLLAVLVLAVSSVLLVYVLGDKKITLVSLLASIPLGLSPFFLECLSYKFLAVYFALSILVCIIPFLFIARKKAFFVCSLVCLLIMCTTYQAASGIYLLLVIILCFQDWNSRKKSTKEIFSFLGIAVFAFCFALLVYRFFLMRPAAYYVSNEMLPTSQIIMGTLENIKNYTLTINRNLSLIWKAGIVLVFVLFIIKSTYRSGQKKPVSFFVSILVIGLSFIASYGVYSLLMKPLWAARALFGFGVFLSILCVYVVSDFKKIAVVTVLALNWCFFTFAFSYGNALADQARYAEFRIGILLHDLSALYPNHTGEDLSIHLKGNIDYTPSIRNIAKHNPVITLLVPPRLEDSRVFDNLYYMEYFNFGTYRMTHLQNDSINENPFPENLPVVLDSYYHTIKSDGSHLLIILKH